MDELLKIIQDAFPPGIPPARPLTAHRCDECDETDRLLGGRTWVDVATDFPQYCHDTLTLLTPSGMAYYLPAYLVFEAIFPGFDAGPSVANALDRGDLNPASFTSARRAAVWAWAESYYLANDRYMPDTVAEGWWFNDAQAAEVGSGGPDGRT